MAYAYYVPLVIQSSQVTGTVSDLVPPINHTFASWKSVSNGGKINNTAGSMPADFDIFSDAGLTTGIGFEVVSWDPTTGAMVAWVYLASAATSTTVYIAYDDPSLNVYQGDNPGTWNNANIVGCLHMEALISGGTAWQEISSGLNLTNTNGTVVTGFIGNGGDFNGTTAFARRTQAFITAPPMTLSMWVNPDAMTGWMLSAFHGTGVWNGYLLALGAAPDNVGFYAISNDFAGFAGATKTGITTGNWQHIAGVTSGVASRYAYLDGVGSSEETTSVTPTVVPSNLVIAAGTSTHGTLNFYGGLVDEVRVSTVARSAAYLEAEYHAQDDPTAFWVLGSEVPVGGAAAWSPYIAPWGWQ